MSGAGFDGVASLAAAGTAAAGTLRLLAAVALAGLALRIMDDALDAAEDRLACGAGAAGAGEGEAGGALPYALACLAAAAALAPRVTAALFFGAYAVGMAGDSRVRLPSGLTGGQEGLLALLASALLAGPQLAAAGAGAMLAVQAFDDVEDAALDRRGGARNLALQLGGGEAWLLGLTGLAVAAALAPPLAAAVLAAVPLVERIGRGTADRQASGRRPGGAGGGRPA